MKKFKLIGHSGCALEVSQVGKDFIVIKTSRDKSYNPRLERQFEKQRAFTSDIFRAPKVLGSRINENGLFEFSMEYISGFSLAEYLKRATPAEIKAIAKKFAAAIPKKRATDPEAGAHFAKKLGELEPTIRASDHQAIKDAYDRLLKYPWDQSIPSYCHGDLALENIIWKDGELYLIDFLDSFYDTWMLDVGKLVFDIESRWSYRHVGTDENLNARLTILKNSLLESLPRSGAEPREREIYHMALLHALRILPYTTDAHTRDHLHASIVKLHALLD